jgi:hypothetical protein
MACAAAAPSSAICAVRSGSPTCSLGPPLSRNPCALLRPFRLTPCVRDLTDNPGFTGALPASFAKLGRLIFLYLSSIEHSPPAQNMVERADSRCSSENPCPSYVMDCSPFASETSMPHGHVHRNGHNSGQEVDTGNAQGLDEH